MKGPIHGKPHKPIKKIPDIPIYEKGMFKENKTSPLLEKVLEIHNSKINEDVSKVVTHVEKINEKILEAANRNYTLVKIIFKYFNKTYYEVAAMSAKTYTDEKHNEYEYYLNSDLSFDKVSKAIEAYYEDAGFDVTIPSSPPGNEPCIEIYWNHHLRHQK